MAQGRLALILLLALPLSAGEIEEANAHLARWELDDAERLLKQRLRQAPKDTRAGERISDG